jgi:dsRNA-specific ribonuclease
MLGPPRDESMRDRDIASAWYGRGATRVEADRLVARLEELGLVRRDDRRRARVWVLAPSETAALPDDAALEERLKADNFKGRLYELCMKLRCARPETAFSTEGAYHVASMRLELDGQALDSGPHRAATRKAAEQLAAARMLAIVEERTRPADHTPVDEQRAAQLRAANPKGRLLERCAAGKAEAPAFESRPVDGGYVARVSLGLDGSRTVSSGWHAAGSLRLAEQAAADELLASLDGAGDGAGSAPDAPVASPVASPAAVPDGAPAPPPSAAAGRDARMVLNEMRQVGLLRDFGYALRGREGPSHQPVFTVAAWAVDPEGARIEGPDCDAPSRKAAERAAAEGLLAALGARGSTG